jgi:signal-transduction protein with cAMP-binding, CBS, and nucleotidyltransferase domain
MYTLGESTPELDALNQKCKRLLMELLPNLPLRKSGVRLQGGNSLFADPNHRNNLYVLREGALEYQRDGRHLFFLDEGDLVGLESYFSTHTASIQSDFTVVLDEYAAEDFFTSIHASRPLGRLWDNYVACQLALVGTLLTRIKAAEFAMKPEIRSFSRGDYIVREGETGKEIYTLLDGRAEITSGDERLSFLEDGDVFGVISLLSGAPYLASVVAATDCMAMTLDREQFNELIQTRHSVVLKIMEDLSQSLFEISKPGAGFPRKVV